MKIVKNRNISDTFSMKIEKSTKIDTFSEKSFQSNNANVSTSQELSHITTEHKEYSKQSFNKGGVISSRIFVIFVSFFYGLYNVSNLAIFMY